MPHSTFGIERFLNIRNAGGPTWSPDGRFVAFLTNVTGVPQLWQVPAEGGWPTQLTFTHEAVRGAHYSPVYHELIFGMDAGGNERNQLFLLRGVAGNTEHGLGDGWNAADISQEPKAIHGFGGWSHDGGQIAFSSNRTKADRFDVYVQKIERPSKSPEKPGELPPPTPAAKLIAEGPGGYYSAAGFSPDDKHLLIVRAESNFNHDLYVAEVATGEVRHLTPHKGDAQYESVGWAPDGKSIYCVTTHGGRDLSTLAQIHLDTGKVTINRDRGQKFEVERVEVSKKGRWQAWIENQDGRSVLFLHDFRSGKTRQPPGLPLGVIGAIEFSPDETRLAFSFDGPRHNGDVWIWDLQTNRLRQLTHSSRAGIPFSTFSEPELVKYKSFDGLEVPAWLFYPSPPPPLPETGRGEEQGLPSPLGGEGAGVRGSLPPCIVYPHGGPESQTRPNFSAIFQYFLSRGYAIFAPNVRGSSGYGTRFMNLDNTVKRMDSVKDMAEGVKWLIARQKADPKRIAVYGGSYGGFMVLAGVTNYPDLFAAGVNVVGIANFVTFLENTGAYRRANREAEYGNLRDHKEFLEKISPIHHVDKIKCPMMIIHGANDPRVPVGEAEQIVAALKKRNVPVEYLRYEDEGHGLVKLKNRLDAYPKMVDFLDRHLR